MKYVEAEQVTQELMNKWLAMVANIGGTVEMSPGSESMLKELIKDALVAAAHQGALSQVTQSNERKS